MRKCTSITCYIWLRLLTTLPRLRICCFRQWSLQGHTHLFSHPLSTFQASYHVIPKSHSTSVGTHMCTKVSPERKEPPATRFVLGLLVGPGEEGPLAARHPQSRPFHLSEPQFPHLYNGTAVLTTWQDGLGD